jgi:exopolysaccharide production protein ExoQ
MNEKVINIIIRLVEKGFVIFSLSIFSGIFGWDSLGDLMPRFIVGLMKYFLWGASIFLVFFFWRDTIFIIKKNLPLIALSFLAFFSFIWSDVPDLTLFNARDIIMMTCFGLYFSARFSLKEQVKLIAVTLFIGICLSVITVVLIPSIGLHGFSGATDVQIENHAGSWRGVYGHKNIMGSTMLLCSLTFFTLPKDCSRLYRWGGFILSLFLMLLSKSRTAFILSFIIIGLVIFCKNFRWRGKISVIFADIGIFFIGSTSLVLFTYWVELLSGLGRDPTLTGRTPIWESMVARLMERPLLGFGRGAFWAPKSKYAIEAGQAIGSGWVPPHGHNGLLDLTIDIGLIGLFLFLITYFTTVIQALQKAYATKNNEELFPIGYLIFLTINNVTESYLLRFANLFWVIFITIAFNLNKEVKLNYYGT